jgi:hypothetical protein
MLVSCTDGVAFGGGSVVQEVRASVINAVSDGIVRGRDGRVVWGVVGMAYGFLSWLWGEALCLVCDTYIRARRQRRKRALERWRQRQ